MGADISPAPLEKTSNVRAAPGWTGAAEKERSGGGCRLLTRSCVAAMLRDHRVEHLQQGFLAGLGQAGDGVELLLDPGGGTALAWEPDGGLSHQNLVERQVQNLGEEREHRSADAASSDLDRKSVA